VPVVRHPIEKWLGSIGRNTIFPGAPFGVGFLAAGLVLAIMTIPIITHNQGRHESGSKRTAVKRCMHWEQRAGSD